jgi:hypothetical protein
MTKAKEQADPAVVAAKDRITKKLADEKLSVEDICSLCTALAKLRQAERHDKEGDWGAGL